MAEYTEQGYRVIALAFKKLETIDLPKERSEVENNLTFLGFLVLENKLKKITSETISILNKCRVRTVMATGDNLLTAVSVGKQCHILKSDENVLIAQIENN